MGKPKLAVVAEPETELRRARRLMRHLRKWGVRVVRPECRAVSAPDGEARPAPSFGVLVGLHVRNTTP